MRRTRAAAARTEEVAVVDVLHWALQEALEALEALGRALRQRKSAVMLTHQPDGQWVTRLQAKPRASELDASKWEAREEFGSPSASSLRRDAGKKRRESRGGE